MAVLPVLPRVSVVVARAVPEKVAWIESALAGARRLRPLPAMDRVVLAVMVTAWVLAVRWALVVPAVRWAPARHRPP